MIEVCYHGVSARSLFGGFKFVKKVLGEFDQLSSCLKIQRGFLGDQNPSSQSGCLDWISALALVFRSGPR